MERDLGGCILLPLCASVVGSVRHNNGSGKERGEEMY